ncbi:NAD(P)-dependent oxidoreductase [Sinorhizobium numidicum]|uniref:NAD(P)-dependent oxidoreductase n=1 Tax=Sinorhizobium numidicum TaxID=680248 RepID=A0ABY8CTZ9_9HYPH|nr:NAD(P)-dependent oxidoreductase [Sinorhizobium numidicum]WEX75625.1 NAD(P)-dependent oxidoreductase [Sinorhizobium numidicum]WEX81622.1 NAD(P)-dependent oxidoreductase [Sinorhizobium numidicum]
MRLVVTGATGFIGARLIDQALSRGYLVTALARNPERVSARKNPRLRIEKWSIGEPLPSVTQSDAIFHLAAYIPADLSDPHQAARCFEVNTNGALQVAMQAASKGVKRFVFFGSGQVYAPALGPVSETSPAFPIDRASYYLASKLAAEICLIAFGKANATPVTVLRLASVYGPGMHGRGMVPTFIRALGSDRSVSIQNGGRYRVDLVYVDDVVALAMQVIENERAGVFNAGSGQTCTSLDAAQTVADVIGADRLLIAVEGGSDTVTQGFSPLDIAKAASQLNYKPRSFREGIEAWKVRTGFAEFQT